MGGGLVLLGVPVAWGVRVSVPSGGSIAGDAGSRVVVVVSGLRWVFVRPLGRRRRCDRHGRREHVGRFSQLRVRELVPERPAALVLLLVDLDELLDRLVVRLHHADLVHDGCETSRAPGKGEGLDEGVELEVVAEVRADGALVVLGDVVDRELEGYCGLDLGHLEVVEGPQERGFPLGGVAEVGLREELDDGLGGRLTALLVPHEEFELSLYVVPGDDFSDHVGGELLGDGRVAPKVGHGLVPGGLEVALPQHGGDEPELRVLVLDRCKHPHDLVRVAVAALGACGRRS